jgi:hypothetical protein
MSGPPQHGKQAAEIGYWLSGNWVLKSNDFDVDNPMTR